MLPDCSIKLWTHVFSCGNLVLANEETLDMFPIYKGWSCKLFWPSSGDKAKHRKQPSTDADLPPTKDRDVRPRKNSQQILVASGVNAELTMQRSQLLTSIRKGIQLKKVQHTVQMKEHMATMPWNVTAILTSSSSDMRLRCLIMKLKRVWYWMLSGRSLNSSGIG